MKNSRRSFLANATVAAAVVVAPLPVWAEANPRARHAHAQPMVGAVTRKQHARLDAAERRLFRRARGVKKHRRIRVTGKLLKAHAAAARPGAGQFTLVIRRRPAAGLAHLLTHRVLGGRSPPAKCLRVCAAARVRTAPGRPGRFRVAFRPKPCAASRAIRSSRSGGRVWRGPRPISSRRGDNVCG